MTDTPTSFPFFKLPPELRRRILLQTDLVTPCGYVEYSGGKFYVSLPPSRAPRHKRCTQNNETENDIHLNTAQQTTDNAEIWDPNWRSPEALLLVSRAFSNLAQSVVLSENHFVAYGGLPAEGYRHLGDIDGGPAWEEAFRLDTATCQAARFVSSAPRCEFLESLRSLEIEFPSAYQNEVKSSGAVLQWQRAFQRFSKTLNPRQLIMHVMGDESIPILKTVYGSHPIEFRMDNLTRPDIIDLVRQSVEMYWPLDRLARLDGVRMFLWDVERGAEGCRLVYYCRHRSEQLPPMAGDLDLFGSLPWPIFHTQRECPIRVGSSSPAEHAAPDSTQPTPWIEGIFVRPGDEDDRWIQHYYERQALERRESVLE